MCFCIQHPRHQVSRVFAALQVPLAYPKMALVGSSADLVRKGQAALGELAGAALLAAPNLGIDFISGKHQLGAGAREVRRASWAKAQGRVRNIHRLKAAKPDSPLPKSRFFYVSVWSGLAYGGEVQGFSPAENFRLRRMAYSVSAYKVRGGCLAPVVAAFSHQGPTARRYLHPSEVC